MISLYANSSVTSYGVKDFILDHEDDLNNFEKRQLKVGNTAFVIETSKYYMLNSKLEWKEIFPYGSGSNPGGGGEDDPSDVIYDGGLV